MLDTMDKAAPSSDGEVLDKPNLSERCSLSLGFIYRRKILSWTRVNSDCNARYAALGTQVRLSWALLNAPEEIPL